MTKAQASYRIPVALFPPALGVAPMGMLSGRIDCVAERGGRTRHCNALLLTPKDVCSAITGN